MLQKNYFTLILVGYALLGGFTANFSSPYFVDAMSEPVIAFSNFDVDKINGKLNLEITNVESKYGLLSESKTIKKQIDIVSKQQLQNGDSFYIEFEITPPKSENSKHLFIKQNDDIIIHNTITKLDSNQAILLTSSENNFNDLKVVVKESPICDFVICSQLDMKGISNDIEPFDFNLTAFAYAQGDKIPETDAQIIDIDVHIQPSDIITVTIAGVLATVIGGIAVKVLYRIIEKKWLE